MYSRTMVHQSNRDESNLVMDSSAPDPDQDYRSYFVVFPELQSIFITSPVAIFMVSPASCGLLVIFIACPDS